MNRLALIDRLRRMNWRRFWRFELPFCTAWCVFWFVYLVCRFGWPSARWFQ